MSSQLPIDEDFVRRRLWELCEDRMKNPGEFVPPCHGCGGERCELSRRKKDTPWEKCVECVGSCLIGKDTKGDWISDPQKKRQLKRCLVSSTNIDWLLHLSQKGYRDHARHQLFVGTLGSFLLGCHLARAGPNSGHIDGTQTIRDWVCAASNLTAQQADIGWWMASLLHDHAYPLAHMLRVAPCALEENRAVLLDQTWILLGYEPTMEPVSAIDVFKDLYEHDFLDKLHEAVNDVRSTSQDAVGTTAPAEGEEEWGKRIDRIVRESLIPDFFGDDELCEPAETCYDHGLLAAANVASFFSPRQRLDPLMKAVIRAIGIHNGRACSRSVHVKKDPLAFLLLLCDTFQEWGRRIVVGDKALYESHRIWLQGVEELENNKYAIESDSLTVVFDYSDTAVLDETEWDYRLFRMSKEEALDRLRISDDFPIRRIRFSIPHEKRLLEC